MQSSKNQKINSSVVRQSSLATCGFATRCRNYTIPTPPEGIAVVMGYQIQTQYPEKVSRLKTIKKTGKFETFSGDWVLICVH